MPRPTEITAPSLAPRLDVLPTHEMAWESFENLLRRMASEVLGLRQVRLYGARGQAQHGIDVVGRNADGEGEAIQSKKYVRFTKRDLTQAVQTFLDKRADLPIAIARLIVAAGCDVDRTEIADELYRFNEDHDDLEIELWDRRDVGDKLRDRRDLVTEFFGDTAADQFCYPAPLHVVTAAAPDRVGMADAVLRGPVSAAGAEQHLAQARRLEEKDPRAAARELLRAEEKLVTGNFAAHASVLTHHRAELLARAGDRDEAVAILSRRFWQALDSYDSHEAETVARLLDKVDQDKDHPAAVNLIAQAAIQVTRRPVGLPDVDIVGTWNDATAVESARLALLVAETAAIDPHSSWTRDNIELLGRLADAVVQDDAESAWIASRLRIEIADATGEWAPLLDAARRRRVSKNTAAVILARHAMHNAALGGFTDADEPWEDAIEQACLDGRNNAAAEWVHSRRVLHSLHVGLAADLDDFPRLVKSLWQAGDETGSPSVHRIEVRALEAVTEHNLPAVLRLREWLRFAHASGYWGTVNHVRRLLARTYQDAGEPDRAAALLIQAARLKDADELARATEDRYVDVRHDLTAPAYWVPATAFRILAVQADLVPDDHVNEIVDAALDVLDRHRAGQLQDTPSFPPSLALEATKAAAALAGRTTIEQASRLLDRLEPSVPRGLDQSRDTDDDHVAACVAIATSHSALREAAVAQLLDLLAQTRSGVAHRVETSASELFSQHPDLVRPRLAELAAEGNRHAGALLSLITDEPSEAQLTAARAAAVELTAASKNTAQSIGVGTGAGRQSLLALHLPPEERAPLVRAQLDRAASPYEPGTNRSEYYLAAAALSDGLEDVDALFEEAMGRAGDASPSPGDLFATMGDHPLSAIRTTGMITDTRSHAAFLAAALARTPEQKSRARTRALSLLGAGSQSSYHAVRALQILGDDELLHHVAFLAVHRDWAARSLAAVIWASNSPTDDTVGLLLANDADQRVRRALAGAIRATGDTEATERIRAVLESDPRHSVRNQLRHPVSGTGSSA